MLEATLNVCTHRESAEIMENAIETLNVGAPWESILLPSILSKCVKHIRNIECGHLQGVNVVKLLLPDTLSMRVNHCRNAEYWHSQVINFVAWHFLKACKTKHEIHEPDVTMAAWMKWSMGPLATLHHFLSAA